MLNLGRLSNVSLSATDGPVCGVKGSSVSASQKVEKLPSFFFFSVFVPIR